MAPRVTRHDNLHPTPENGLTYCWCMQSCCWLPGSRTLPRGQTGRESKTGREGGRLTGSCICRDCPCPHAGPQRHGSGLLGFSSGRAMAR